MSEVRRHHTCPVCELRFVVVFDEHEPVGEYAVKVECPRAPDGGPRPAAANGASCWGYLMTHVPERHQVAPADY
jgi:hypothetical protein